MKYKIKEPCKKCDGLGIVPDMFERISTFGISWFFDKASGSKIGWETCKKCKGMVTTKIIKYA